MIKCSSNLINLCESQFETCFASTIINPLIIIKYFWSYHFYQALVVQSFKYFGVPLRSSKQERFKITIPVENCKARGRRSHTNPTGPWCFQGPPDRSTRSSHRTSPPQRRCRTYRGQIPMTPEPSDCYKYHQQTFRKKEEKKSVPEFRTWRSPARRPDGELGPLQGASREALNGDRLYGCDGGYGGHRGWSYRLSLLTDCLASFAPCENFFPILPVGFEAREKDSLGGGDERREWHVAHLG